MLKKSHEVQDEEGKGLVQFQEGGCMQMSPATEGAACRQGVSDQPEMHGQEELGQWQGSATSGSQNVDYFEPKGHQGRERLQR